MGIAVVHYFQLASQMLLYFRAVYLALLFSLEALVFIYKALVLPYEPASLALEVILLFVVLAFLHAAHTYMSIKGNLTFRYLALGVGLALVIPDFVGDLYFTLWQTYVLRVEIIVFSIDLCFLFLGGIAQSLVIIVKRATEVT